MISSRDHAQPTTAGKGTLTLAALTAALLVSGCEVEVEAPSPPPAFEELSRTYREGFASHQPTAILLRETATGCLYSVAEGKGASAVLTPNGKHAGCARGSAEGVAAPVAGESSREESLQAKEAGQ